jgi:hypothetical protein
MAKSEPAMPGTKPTAGATLHRDEAANPKNPMAKPECKALESKTD